MISMHNRKYASVLMSATFLATAPVSVRAVETDLRNSAVFVQTDELLGVGSVGNRVLAWVRNPDGSLTFGGSYPTSASGGLLNNGLGDSAGDPISGQGSVRIVGNYLFVTNAGFNGLSSTSLPNGIPALPGAGTIAPPNLPLAAVDPNTLPGIEALSGVDSSGLLGGVTGTVFSTVTGLLGGPIPSVGDTVTAGGGLGEFGSIGAVTRLLPAVTGTTGAALGNTLGATLQIVGLGGSVAADTLSTITELVTPLLPTLPTQLNGSVSVFRINQNDLTLCDVEDSGGLLPFSVAAGRGFAYVVNGYDTSITGYRFNDQVCGPGTLTAISGSHRVLPPDLYTQAISHPAQVLISPTGTAAKVVVTERNLPPSLTTNGPWVIDVLSLNTTSGLTSNLVRNKTTDNLKSEPFGAIYDSTNHLLVTQGRFEIPFGSTDAAYTVNSNNTLTTITDAAASTGFDDCWIDFTAAGAGGDWVYTHSFFDSTIHLFHNVGGHLTLVNGAEAITNPLGLQVAGGIDIATAGNSSTGAFLYALNGAPGVGALPPNVAGIHGYAINPATGALTPLPDGPAGLPLSTVGIAAK